MILKNGKVIETSSVVFTESFSGKRSRAVTDSQTIGLDSVVCLENAFAKFEVRSFRQRVVVARVIEAGAVNLYDFPNIRRENAKYYSRIHATRLCYRLEGDSVLKPLRRKDFKNIFSSSFAASYPTFIKTRNQYARLNLLYLSSLIMLTGGELAVGSLQGGSSAVLYAYTAVSVGGLVYVLATRQKTLRKVRTLVAAYNAGVKNGK
ncbi:MAG: hypothetical protein NTW29_11815 [Bacteroidetes bacterium]|nr:hypothetical protein [Bacteroidota bacterium]